MPEYLTPGVYVEEFEIGAKPIEGVSTSTAGFLGITERGPTSPRLVTNWLQFQRMYGSYIAGSYLPYAVDGFFMNGGQRCFIGRVAANDAEKASLKLTSAGTNALTLDAIGEGEWGKRIVVKVGTGTDSTAAKPLFKLSVFYWKDQLPSTLFDPETNKKSKPQPAQIEFYDNLSMDNASPDHYDKKINGISSLITISSQTGDSGTLPDGPAVVTPLGGTDLDGTALGIDDYLRDSPADNIPGSRKGLTAFKEIDEISIVYSPDANSVTGLVPALISHCEELKDRFAVIDADDGSSNVSNIKPRDNFDTKYAAFYYPWIKVIDPLTNKGKLIPPGGHMAGIYARSDVERGVHKAPANEVVRGAMDLEFQITKGEQGILNPRGVNVIRAFPGRGIRIWGARTLSSDALWKYINVRRLFIFVEESIEEGTQWVVFEPNDEKLWARVRATITQFLTRVWRDGALMGTKPEEAFFVKCDRTTMTQDDIDNGRLICIIGIAPVKPAEFVIFRIAQWAGGSSATE
ncbi:MAG: Phage tail sheath protein [Candidatus Methanoperedens nitroreducens]|uniref:Phage tail sheath protein n=1 Tax=Candidatus Methanoperedens nitratireducens TaxID=1392998 RepID=A0A0P8A275_9EURY|nr:phage tail sheath family protein [Candidatus Methanoperedens sp. BLZ2]KAB2944605.1 MAG: phage tail sheath family protein [Candidatus Methanoperedens sp.]KPQ42144.1 MAG: Phage tail sheath protein [Candidatus Methanoperedens sp. BLZ1]MBZ0176872.1 phage tail sheath family protein [Candidatus Methanoperedens nitroreducens]CAG0986331.1 Putative prophage major tail sheath protein [Methanosarcinales archaeon]MCX9077104.1 phage tail sheath family protein [Candidatus Methanoperedens sp.]